jgi:hypothetical protein
MSVSTKQQPPIDHADIRALADVEVGEVSGGMKWVRGHKSPNVIDARGGQGSFGSFHWTLDINGNVSSLEVR